MDLGGTKRTRLYQTRQNRSQETLSRKKDTKSTFAKSNVEFNFSKKSQDKMIIPNSPYGDEYGYDYDYYTDYDYDYGATYSAGNGYDQNDSFITDDLPTVQFETDDGSKYTQHDTQTTESMTKNSTLDQPIRIPVFRFPDQNTEHRQRRRRVRSSNSPGREGPRKHFKAPPLDTQVREFDSSTTGISQKKHLSPAPKFISEMDTPSDIDDEPHSPKRRLKRRQRQLQALKQKEQEDENNPTIPNDSFSDDETTNPLKPFEIAAEEFRKRAVEEKERQQRLEEEKRKRQLEEEENRRRQHEIELQETDKQEQLRIPRVRTRTRGTYTYTTTQDGTSTGTYTSQADSYTTSTTREETQQTTQSIRRTRRQRGQQIVPELQQQPEERKPIITNTVSDERPAPVPSPPSTMAVVEKPQLKKVPLNPTNNEAVNNLMNDIDSKQSFFASLEKEGKKGIFVSDDDLLEQLPTIGNGVEIDEVPPVREAPEITHSTRTNTNTSTNTVSPDKNTVTHHHTTTSELPSTAHMVQMDEVEEIYIDKKPGEDLESLPQIEDFGPPPPDPISGSAVVDLVTETKMKKLTPLQEVLPLSEVEDSYIESYTATRDTQPKLPPALQNLKAAEPEVLSIDSMGNTPTTESYTSTRKRPTRGRPTTDTQQRGNSTTIDSSSTITQSTQNQTGRRQFAAVQDIGESSTLESTESSYANTESRSTATVTNRFIKQNAVQEISSESDIEPRNALEQRILAGQQFIAEKNKQAEEKRLLQQQQEEERMRQQKQALEEAERQRKIREEQARQLEQQRLEQERQLEQQRLAEERAKAQREQAERERLDRERKEAALQKQREEEERKRQEEASKATASPRRIEDPNLRQKAQEAERMRQRIELEQRIRPDPNGNERAILALPTDTTTITNDHRAVENTNESAQSLIYGQIQIAQQNQIDPELESISVEPKVSLKQRPLRSRIQQLHSTTQESATTKGLFQDAEFLDPEPTLPDTLSTVAPTTAIHDDKANCFKDSTYRNTQPTIKKQELLPNPEQFIQSKIEQPLDPVPNWLKFQVNLIPLPNNTQPCISASSKYDFETLLNNIRAV